MNLIIHLTTDTIMELFLRLFIMEMGLIEITLISKIIIDFNLLVLIVINAVSQTVNREEVTKSAGVFWG